MTPTRILIVDDHAMIRRGLATILTHDLGGYTVQCDEAGNGLEALQKVAHAEYDLAILDISMPGMDGLELLTTLKRQRTEMPVLVVSMHSEEHYALRVLRAGASGFLTKQQAADELVAAVTQVLGGSRYISPELAKGLINHAIAGNAAMEMPSHAILSNREFQIFKLLAAGQIPKAIATDLNISIKTISAFKKRFFAKMGFHTDSDMITYAVNNKLIDRMP